MSGFKTKFILPLVVVTAVSACTDALVYGDRTGFNLAVRTDATDGHPLEVNAGLQRRIAGFVPAKQIQDGVATGEAANMMSSQNVAREAGEGLGLGDTITINNTFVSGPAAVEASGNKESVKAIFNAPGLRVSDKREDVDAMNALLRYTAASEANRADYLQKARVLGLKVGSGDSQTVAKQAILDPANAAGNRAIAQTL